MNILILAVGTRNLVIRSFKEVLAGHGKVMACDVSPLAPALYEADLHFLTPPITSPGYIDFILKLCEENEVDGVFSLIDPELPLLAQHELLFRRIGVTVVGSRLDLAELALDKYKMYQALSAYNFACAQTFDCFDVWQDTWQERESLLPAYVKPRFGSASQHVYVVDSAEKVRYHFANHDYMIIQEALTGDEYGADIYVDLLSGKVVRVFIKRKLQMRAGETDKSVSILSPKLTDQLVTIIETFGFRGPVDVDFFLKDEGIVISEVNTRFGGGYPHAVAMGINFAPLIVENLRGNVTAPVFNQYADGVHMMKYSEVILRDHFEVKNEVRV